MKTMQETIEYALCELEHELEEIKRSLDNLENTLMSLGFNAGCKFANDEDVKKSAEDFANQSEKELARNVFFDRCDRQAKLFDAEFPSLDAEPVKKKKRRQLTNENKQAVLSLFAMGKKRKEIASICDLSYSSVTRILKGER